VCAKDRLAHAHDAQKHIAPISHILFKDKINAKVVAMHLKGTMGVLKKSFGPKVAAKVRWPAAVSAGDASVLQEAKLPVATTTADDFNGCFRIYYGGGARNRFRGPFDALRRRLLRHCELHGPSITIGRARRSRSKSFSTGSTLKADMPPSGAAKLRRRSCQSRRDDSLPHERGGERAVRVVRWRMADGGWQLAMAAAVVVIVVVVLVVVAVVVVGAGVFGIGAKRGAAGRECLRFWAEGLEYVEAGYVRHGAAVDEQLVKGAAVGFPSSPHLHLAHAHFHHTTPRRHLTSPPLLFAHANLSPHL
jgi:hypothetical protein